MDGITRREDILASRSYYLTQPGEEERQSYLPFSTAALWVERPYPLWVWTECLLLTVWEMIFQVLVR
jgi:hypothetical protein